jgi:catechol 2,3-dioxygenase-like lactoylglutathione lyase family enzyme
VKRLIVLLFVFAAPLLAQKATSVDAVGMTVSNMDRSVAFYRNVLSFEPVSDVEAMGEELERATGIFGARTRTVTMRLGHESVVLTEYVTPKGRPIPVDARSNDRSFQHIAIVVSDMDKAYERLRENKVEHVSTAPQRIPDSNKAAAGIRAFYFRDPDEHNLEVIWFPGGKGDPRWQTTNGRLFLGIDHTALVVSSTDASLRFYRDLLGLQVAGESENFGTEQEHLNLVEGARLRISGLRATAGPGVEFLDYLSPRDGRAYEGASPNDIVHWQTTIRVDDVDALAKKLRDARVTFVSRDVVGDSALVRDPDGHVILLQESR